MIQKRRNKTEILIFNQLEKSSNLEMCSILITEFNISNV